MVSEGEGRGLAPALGLLALIYDHTARPGGRYHCARTVNVKPPDPGANHRWARELLTTGPIVMHKEPGAVNVSAGREVISFSPRPYIYSHVTEYQGARCEEWRPALWRVAIWLTACDRVLGAAPSIWGLKAQKHLYSGFFVKTWFFLTN
jgi:hypothetical protein